MSINKLMHPRNIYKNPPNFKQMAIDFPEFRKYIQQDITGKIKIDFKNPEALCALSHTLLKKDFNLDVHIPLNRLIPTIPLRLNYILWIEDLISIINKSDIEQEIMQGIDIGTGASCIYPLLAAKLYNWLMIATEIDDESITIANENVQRNKLERLITVKHVTGETLLKDVLESDKNYYFCMCNPPFFGNEHELNPKSKSRSDKRCLPRNAPSGAMGEVVAPGGEIEFISKLIRESVELKHRIKIFTTMVGQKSSLPILKSLLRNVDATSFKQTEFHQGHTTRWGLAWSFFDVDLRTAPQATVAAAKKKPKPPQKYVLPFNAAEISLENVANKMRLLFQTLHMNYAELKRNQFMYALEVIAKENTWSHQRRKRREQFRQNTEPNNMSLSSCDPNSSLETNNSTESNEMDVNNSAQKRNRSDDTDDEEGYCNLKKIRIEENNEEIYLKINVILRKLANEYHIEMNYANGIAGRDSVHQVMQYVKNNLK